MEVLLAVPKSPEDCQPQGAPVSPKFVAVQEEEGCASRVLQTVIEGSSSNVFSGKPDPATGCAAVGEGRCVEREERE